MKPKKLAVISEEFFMSLNQFSKEEILALLKLKFDDKWGKFFIDDNLVAQKVANEFDLQIEIITDQEGNGNDVFCNKKTREIEKFTNVKNWVESNGGKIVERYIEWGIEK